MLSVRTYLNSSAMHWLDSILVIINAVIITLYHVAVFNNFPTIHHMLGQSIPKFLYLLTFMELLRVIGDGKDFLKDHRNIFAVLVLGSAWVFNIPYLTILLLFNVLKTLHALDLFPKTRHVLDTLFHALPGVMNLVGLIILTYFIFAVLGTCLFGEKIPEMWGTIPQSLLSLQQIMLGDGWGDNIRALTKFYPYAWIFPNVFMILVSFVLLNVFIGVIVDAMQTAEEDSGSDDAMQSIRKEISELRDDVTVIKDAVGEKTNPSS